MRLGFKTALQHTVWKDLLEVWTEADGLDIFESGWTFDHFYPIFSDSTGPCLEGWVTTTALAQATRRLRVGVLVSGNVYRHPAVLANMAATLDVISDGRLELGLGAGWNAEECSAYGIHLPSLSTRFDMLEEACEILTRLLGPDATSNFSGAHYELVDARCEPKPVQLPRPPLCIGGSGERRTLRAVARYADHWNYPGGTPGDFTHKLEVLAAHCEDIGRDPAGITCSAHLHGVTAGGDCSELRRHAEQYAEAGLDLAIVVIPAPLEASVVHAVADSLADLATTGDSRR